jgi:hypothetical protein
MSEEDLFRTYNAELRATQALDLVYYVNSNPSSVDRAAYYQRQERTANLRSDFYAQLEARRSQHPDNQNEARTVADECLESRCRLIHELNNWLSVIVGYADLAS